tara:strand:- start:6 stop:371 length:366 start_codon:yes stop_codon:yes gene_type:complete
MESKALLPTDGALPSKVIEVSPVALKAVPPIEVTLSGMVMDVSSAASSNALPPIEVTVPGIVADPLQSSSPLTAFPEPVNVKLPLLHSTMPPAAKLLREVAPITIMVATASFLKCLILERT